MSVNIRGPIFSIEKGKKIPITEGVSKMAWNIKEALETPKGSRPCLPEFGSRLHELQFTLIDEVFFDLCKIFINDCLNTSVENVQVKNIKVEKKDRNSIQFDILFVDENTMILGNYSFSFDNGKWNM